MPPPGIHLRAITPEDAELLARIYASTRTEELSVLPWTQAQKDAFLRSQFEAQHAHYQQHYVGADFLVVMRGELPLGRLYLFRSARELRIVDIALLPEHRGTGLGRALLEELLRVAEVEGRKVSIHVERMNRALGLYQRLGFRTVRDEGGVYLLLEWAPPLS
jgi:ribosomal protein S18 acetylase RimI-like enzyme